MAVVQKIRCEVARIIPHGIGVYSVYLKPEKRLPNFKAGQFCHVTVDPYCPSGFWPESRVFSIASSPEIRDELRICYSVVGKYTKKMESVLNEGSSVWVKLPYGDFVVGSHPYTALFAGGSGISPFLPFIQSMDNDRISSVTLIYGARKESLLIDMPVLKEKVEKCSAFKLIVFSESGFCHNEECRNRFREKYFNGRIEINQIVKEVAMIEQSAFYLSGPPKMVQYLKTGIYQLGVPKDNIFIDAW